MAESSTPHRARESAGHPPASAAQRSLQRLLQRLRESLQSLFRDRGGAARHRRGVMQRRLLLGLELMCKLEEQLLLPALADAEPAAASAVALAGNELELMRDLSALAPRTSTSNRDVVLAVLEGLATLHFQRMDELLQRNGLQDLPWAELEQQMRRLLGRWRNEVNLTGDIEDEERDPVGLPPR